MKKQFYGITYPFNDESERLTFLDMNETKNESIRSMLLHIILTPKGQRLRMPNFGTNLISYIFESNDTETWENIKDEIRKQVSLYLPNVIFDDIKIIHNTEEENSIFIELLYSIENNGVTTQNNTIVKL